MRRMATRIPGALPAPTAAVLAACLLLAGALTACDVDQATRARGPAPPGFPVTITNCGVTTTYQRPPRRVVTMNQHATEIMLALGLAGRMVGTAYLDDRILPRYREEYRKIPVLSERYPSYEVLLKAAPDFVYGGFASAFSEQAGRSRDRLRDAGIRTYLNVQDCANEPTTMRLLWQELRTVAKIFGVERRALELIANLRARLTEVDSALAGAEPVNVLVYNGGTKVPRVAGGNGIANEIVRLAGGRNVFAGLDEERAVDVSWEQLAHRRPDVIVLVYYGDTSPAEKKRFLLSKPALAGTPAVRNGRFAALPLSATVLGIRAPRAVGELARQLHPERFR